MYSTASISALAKRIGWAQPRQPSYIVLSTENLGISGRTFDSFHKMLTVENIAACMPISNALTAQETVDNASVNEYLSSLRQQGALKVLGRVFDSNVSAQSYINALGVRVDTSQNDWSNLILTRTPAMDECLGYQVAYDCLELILTTARTNYRELNGKENGTLKLEQNGVTDDQGRTLSDGVFSKLERAYANAISSLFPTYKGPTIRNASHRW